MTASASTLSPVQRVQLAHDLRQTIHELRDRGLLVAVKWASELLSSLPKEYRLAPNLPFSPPLQPHQQDPGSSPITLVPRQSMEFLPSPGPGAFDRSMEAGPSRPKGLDPVDILEEDEFQLAKSYFDIKELDRVVFVLREAKSKRAIFLRIYSAFLSADRKAQEALPHFLDTKEERFALYPPLNALLDELAGDPDPYLTYLRGIIHMRLDQRSAAIECFVQSVKEKPYNWSCWSQLAQLIKSPQMLVGIKERLPSSPMLTFCAITVMLDLHTATDMIMNMIDELLEIFPHSIHLQSQAAMVYYHMRDFETAEKQFDAVHRIDPYRMDEVDIYSNMLYVMDKRAKLGKLAHEYAEIDRNRAEVCCLIGNYYSSRADHTKAIIYFKRALMLNREYLPAWTLMGHEYVELKNSHAAIEAYRKAIADVNAKDYRAWYGLGQAYELLDMPMYAIEYYNQATSLRPNDCRMWTALATVYEGLQRLPDAIQAHNRALLGADSLQTPTILQKLASLHVTLAQAHGESHSAESVEYHKRLLIHGEQSGTNISELVESYMAVAEWELRGLPSTRQVVVGVGHGRTNKTEGDWALAQRYLEKVSQTHTTLREKAEELLRLLKTNELRRV
ncbi:anaphase-promoting complex subunit 8 [Tremella mesenterica]|uniref:Anaphase-promoting complex subunit 8 n=1 Tax=Tremella mesenterica TaxID=5217 RepID=A0A4Q1B8D2_TREME|nr:anaphase-promoting complex subunit 8 [Tremella mesenterica]